MKKADRAAHSDGPDGVYAALVPVNSVDTTAGAEATRHFTACEILEMTEKFLQNYDEKPDVLPVIAAVADPKHIRVGVSIQTNYPLTLIERGYGIPFGRYRSDATSIVSKSDELHGFKWSIETHQAVFKADATAEERWETEGHRRVVIELSTGVGNVLQNLRSLAYVDRSPFMVVGERPDHPPPYPCLVEYEMGRATASNRETARHRKIGVELLLFNGLGGCQRVDKSVWLQKPVQATMMEAAKEKYEDKIRWAVSGYPLLLDGSRVSLEMTTRNVSDYRHVWKLPILKKSLADRLKGAATKSTPDKIEFYIGFDEIRTGKAFVRATQDQVLSLSTELAMPEEWLETMCSVCKIDESTLFKCFGQVGDDSQSIRFRPEDVIEDFVNEGYVRKSNKEEVVEQGDFFVDGDANLVWTRLRPAVYPHHIVGVSEDGLVSNISICGQSGRSGITIEDAKDLCEKLRFHDALIFDNGNDVFARIKGDDVIRHVKNISRQTRLTAALHFASRLDPGPRGGFELVSNDFTVAGRVKTGGCVAGT